MDETTLFLAKLIGPYLLVSGFGFLLSREFYAKMQAGSTGADPIAINLSGMTHFLSGLALCLVHFQWASPLEIVVTLCGVAALLKGVTLIAIPTIVVDASERLMNTDNGSQKALFAPAAGFLAAGGYMTYSGYFA